MPKGIPKNGINKGWIKKGQRLSIKTEFKKGMCGESSSNWKGDKVGYHALHSWVQRQLGKPSVCENCGKDNLTGMKIHWANVSGEYKRELSDWKRLCVHCHYIFDNRNKLNKEDIVTIKKLRRDGVIQREVAEIFSVSRTLISAIDTGRTWGEIK